MKTFKIFSTAALALMMAACSSEDTALNNSPAAGPQMQFSATIAAPSSGATTRTEYTEVTEGEAAGTINVVWKAGDEIALIHNGVKDVATVKTVNADGSATITGFITKAENGDGVEVCYPAALWEWAEKSEFVEKSCAIRNETFVTNITTKQDGTLKYIQDNLDTRMGEGKLKVDGDKATLSDNVKLASQIAIWKLALQDDAETPAALSATQVSVKVDGETPVTIASTEKLSTATSSVYLAIDKLDAANITIEATVGEDTYSYTNEEISLDLGQYYQSTVKMSLVKIVDLSTVTKDITIKDGFTVEGTLAGKTQPYKISIAKGATVTLDGVTINGEDDYECEWAGITCEGDATIILKDGSTNTVTGFFSTYPGIQAGPKGTTLTIKGTGLLTASCSNAAGGGGAGIGGNSGGSCGSIVIEGGSIRANGSYGAGIGSGSGSEASCGAITISGGTVTATDGAFAAAIGSGNEGSCGNISISGGTVSATGGNGGAGIGSGCDGSCGTVTITDGVTQVTATMGKNATNSIGTSNEGSCGTVTIGGDATTYAAGVAESPFVYPTPSVALSAVTSADYLGWRICSDGNAYAAAGSLPTGVTAVAMIAYVGSETGVAGYTHGLAIALADEGTMNWSTAKSTCEGKTAITGAKWCLPSQGQWKQMFKANGDDDAKYTGLNTTITTAGGTTLNAGEFCWSSSESSPGEYAYYLIPSEGDALWGEGGEDRDCRVRACLAF